MTAVRVDLDADVTECGDLVTGQVDWDEHDPPARRVVVRLSFATDGTSSPGDTGGPDEVVLDASGGGPVRFELAVPSAGPITFKGTTVSVSWQVEARLDVPSRPDVTAVHAVTVLPAGGLAVWARQSAPPPKAGS